LIVDNAFDLEVLYRAELGLRALPKPLDCLNARILQAHDLWHILAGYEATALHEIAISGFQMGQFGHNYSAMFLAVVATVATAGEPAGAPIFLTLCSRRLHAGAKRRPCWTLPGKRIGTMLSRNCARAFGVTAFASLYPAGLIEQLAGMRAA
jgi:hypothetical protein